MLGILFVAFGLLTFLLYIRFNNKTIFIFLLITLLALSLLPSLRVPYVRDDFVFIHNTMENITLQNLLQPFGESISLPRKIIHHLAYRFFLLDPRPFHIYLIVLSCMSLFVFYLLLRKMTRSENAALFGSFLFGLSNVHYSAGTFISQIHISCLFFILLFLYSTYHYFDKKNKMWMGVSIFTGLLASLTFVLGVLAGIWVLLFAFLVIFSCDKDLFKKNIKDLLFLLSGWGLGFVLNLIHIHQTVFQIYTSEIKVIHTGLRGHSVLIGLISLRNIINPLIMHAAFHWTISILIFGVFLWGYFRYKKQIQIGIINFFVLWILVHYFIIDMGRQCFENPGVGSYYNLFPMIGLCGLYAVVFSKIEENIKKRFPLKRSFQRFIVAFLVIAVFTFCGYERSRLVQEYSRNNALKKWVLFYSDFYQAVFDYQKLHKIQHLALADDKACISRDVYFKPCILFSDLADIVLGPKLYSKIKWEERTDKDFMAFVQGSGRYNNFAEYLKK